MNEEDDVWTIQVRIIDELLFTTTGIATHAIMRESASTITATINPPSSLRFDFEKFERKQNHARLLYTAYQHRANNVFLPTCRDDGYGQGHELQLWTSACIPGVLATVHMGIARPLLPFHRAELNSSTSESEIDSTNASENKNTSDEVSPPFSELQMLRCVT